MIVSIAKRATYTLFFLTISLWFSCCSTKPSHANLDHDFLAAHGYTEAGDSLIVPPFEIEVTLSEAAQKAFSHEYETIVVTAYFSGTQSKESNMTVAQMGGLYFASRQIEMEKSGIARFEGIKISKQVFAALEQKDFKVLVTISSGKKSSIYYVVYAEPIQETISKMTASRHQVLAKSTRE